MRTSWINPDPSYDAAADKFVEAVLDPARNSIFLRDLAAFVDRIAQPGLWNGLAQVVLKITAPGIPDVYQGTELWDFSLVDPDNRRLVDYEVRKTALDAILRGLETRGAAYVDGLMDAPENGHIKLLVLALGLRFRRRRQALLERGAFVPLRAQGTHADRVIAFARVHEDHAVIAAAGRFFLGLGTGKPCGDLWQGTLILPPEFSGRRIRNIYTRSETRLKPDAALPLPELFAHLPVALLDVSAPDGSFTTHHPTTARRQRPRE